MTSNSNDDGVPPNANDGQQPPIIIFLGGLPEGGLQLNDRNNNAMMMMEGDDDDEDEIEVEKHQPSSSALMSPLGGVPRMTSGAGPTGRHNFSAAPTDVLTLIAFVMLSYILTSGGGGGKNGSGNGGDGSGSDAGGSGSIIIKKRKTSPAPSEFRLANVGGLDEQVAYLKRSVILPMVRPDVLTDWGVRPPKGIMFHGPPGTGKTFLAKALVNELQLRLKTEVNFLYRKGGDVFSMWFGESEERLRKVFQEAKESSPSVLFFDEIDALCPTRDGANHGTDAYNAVVTCFLGEMDSLNSNNKQDEQVFVIGATNRLDSLDPAVLRPGRFDKHIPFGFPDEMGRRRILQIHTRNWSKQDQLDDELLLQLAQRTVGYSGADLEKLCKEVVYVAIEANGGKVDNDLVIKVEHWLEAMGQMQPTAPDNFGSSLSVPSKPNPVISKLIRPVVHQAMEKIKYFLTTESLERSSPTGLKSLLLYSTPEKSKDFMEAYIVQGILSEQQFNKVSMYQLSPTSIKESILNGKKPSVLAAINDVLHQAQENRSGNVTCLIVLSINEILEMAKEEVSSKLILQALSKFRGPKKLLLATSSLPPDEIEDQRFNELFQDPERNRLQVENLDRIQLKQLFQSMFQGKLKGKRGQGDLLPILEEVADKAARYSDGDNYDHVLNLYDALSQVQIRSDVEAMREEYDQILEEYQRTKLRF